MRRLLVGLFLFFFITNFSCFVSNSFAESSKHNKEIKKLSPRKAKKIEELRKAEERSAKIEKIEVYYLGERPKRKYKILTPISDKSRNEQRSYNYLREDAVDLGADAIIDFHCTETMQQEFWTYLARAYSACNGKAIQWLD